MTSAGCLSLADRHWWNLKNWRQLKGLKILKTGVCLRPMYRLGSWGITKWHWEQRRVVLASLRGRGLERTVILKRLANTVKLRRLGSLEPKS